MLGLEGRKSTFPTTTGRDVMFCWTRCYGRKPLQQQGLYRTEAPRAPIPHGRHLLPGAGAGELHAGQGWESAAKSGLSQLGVRSMEDSTKQETSAQALGSTSSGKISIGTYNPLCRQDKLLQRFQPKPWVLRERHTPKSPLYVMLLPPLPAGTLHSGFSLTLPG